MFFFVWQQIRPEAYSNIFNNSLEPDVLNQILKTLRDFFMQYVL